MFGLFTLSVSTRLCGQLNDSSYNINTQLANRKSGNRCTSVSSFLGISSKAHLHCAKWDANQNRPRYQAGSGKFVGLHHMLLYLGVKHNCSSPGSIPVGAFGYAPLVIPNTNEEVLQCYEFLITSWVIISHNELFHYRFLHIELPWRTKWFMLKNG